jgi:hypothetical protein
MALRGVLKFHIGEGTSAAADPVLSLGCLADRKGNQWKWPPGWLALE